MRIILLLLLTLLLLGPTRASEPACQDAAATIPSGADYLVVAQVYPCGWILTFKGQKPRYYRISINEVIPPWLVPEAGDCQLWPESATNEWIIRAENRCTVHLFGRPNAPYSGGYSLKLVRMN